MKFCDYKVRLTPDSDNHFMDKLEDYSLNK